jgi:translation initiation factor IF-3
MGGKFMLIMDEQIKASEVLLTGLDGEDLGIVSREEALRMAKERGVSLVCTSLMSSPPPAKLIGSGAAKQEAQQAKKREQPSKLKEIRLTPQIEDHDLETKKQQAERILKSGDAVQLIVKIQGKEGPRAKEVLQSLIRDLAQVGKPTTGIQLSGKQAAVQLNPL